jgi:hypothetical protein
VAAGSYTENININKAVSVTGPNAGVPGTGARVAEAVLLNCDIDITATGAATLDGFDILQNNNTALDVVQVASASPATIENNKIERFGALTTGVIARGVSISGGSAVKVIEDNLFTGDGSNLFSGHKTWNNAIYVNGTSGNSVTIQNNWIENSRTALNIDDIASGINVSGNTFNNCGTFISIGGTVAPTGQFALGSNDFKNPVDGIVNLSNVSSTFRLDITSSKLDGVVFSSLPLSTLFLVEATMYHRGRDGRNGLVYFVAGNEYVYGPLTTIQSAVNYGASGDVITVKAGSYNERVTVSKPLTIQGEDKVTTIVTGTGLVGAGSGFFINSGIANVTI